NVGVPASFWLVAANANLRKELPKGTGSLSAAQLPKWYLPFLVQDVVAARALLDTKHDARELNSRNLLLVAAGEGVQLAAVWLAPGARRYGLTPLLTRAASPPESSDLMGAVWIDFSPRLGGLTLPRAKTKDPLSLALKEELDRPPMLFLSDRANRA